MVQYARSLSGSLGISKDVLVRTDETRAMYVMGAYLYVLVGKYLYKVDSAWNKTLLGEIGTTTGNAWILGDGLSLCIVDGVNGYYFNC